MMCLPGQEERDVLYVTSKTEHGAAETTQSVGRITNRFRSLFLKWIISNQA